MQNYLSCVHYQGHLSVHNVDGSPSDAQGESTLDIEMAAGLAPSANINLYQTDGSANGDTWMQVNDELQQIINANTNNASAGSVVRDTVTTTLLQSIKVNGAHIIRANGRAANGIVHVIDKVLMPRFTLV